MSKCLHPLHLKNGNVVPCGRCYQCRSRVRSEWSFRVQCQMDVAKSVYFCTMTYNDENLGFTLTPYYVDVQGNIFQPLNHLSENLYYVKHNDNSIQAFRLEKLPDWCLNKVISVDDLPKYTEIKYVPSVQKEHIKLFVDKFQHVCKRKLGCNLRYFISAEYGDEYLRPHYHAIFFLDKYINVDFEKLLESVWSYGFVQCDPPRGMSAVTYCMKYLLKGSKTPEGALRCFSLKSKGLGKNFIDDSSNYEYLKENLLNSETLSASVAFRDSGRHIPCPRYFLNKIVDNLSDDVRLLRSSKKNYLSLASDYNDIKEKFITYYNRFLRSRPLGDSTMVKYGCRVNMSDYDEFLYQYDGYETIQYLDSQDKGRSTIKESDGQ